MFGMRYSCTHRRIAFLRSPMRRVPADGFVLFALGRSDSYAVHHFPPCPVISLALSSEQDLSLQPRPLTLGVAMQRFVHNENLALYRKLISESELDLSRDEGRHKMLLTLLAEEMMKDGNGTDAKRPLDS